MQGTRYAAALGMLKDKLAAVTMLSLALIPEPLRFVTAWCMVRAREAMDQCARPPVFDLLYAPYSCITHVCQYSASLISEKV